MALSSHVPLPKPRLEDYTHGMARTCPPMPNRPLRRAAQVAIDAHHAVHGHVPAAISWNVETAPPDRWALWRTRWLRLLWWLRGPGYGPALAGKDYANAILPRHECEKRWRQELEQRALDVERALVAGVPDRCDDEGERAADSEVWLEQVPRPQDYVVPVIR